MKKPPKGLVRPEKVDKARQKAMAGFYEGPAIIDATVDILLRELSASPNASKAVH